VFGNFVITLIYYTQKSYSTTLYTLS